MENKEPIPSMDELIMSHCRKPGNEPSKKNAHQIYKDAMEEHTTRHLEKMVEKIKDNGMIAIYTPQGLRHNIKRRIATENGSYYEVDTESIAKICADYISELKKTILADAPQIIEILPTEKKD